MNRISSILLRAALPAALLTACTTTVTDDIEAGEESVSRAINFGTPALSRSAINNANDAAFDAFKVWGWSAPASGGTSAVEFDGETVSRNPSGLWTYDGYRYWQEGRTYDFYAVYPAEIREGAVNVTSDGVITISDYNAKQNYDLMTAKQEDMDGDTPTKVAFTFNHLLSNLVFVARTAPAVQQSGVTMTITSFRLNGFPVTASYNSSNNPAWNVNTPENVRYESTDELPLTGTEYTDVTSLLVFPQRLGPSLTYQITYRSSQGVEYTQSGRLQNVSGDVARWQEGLRYRYTMDLGADYILFGKPEVEEWEEISGGRWNVE